MNLHGATGSVESKRAYIRSQFPNEYDAGARAGFTNSPAYALLKATGAWSFGAPIYWDGAAKVCTATAGSNKKIGVAAKAAENADDVGYVKLSP